MKLLNSRSQSVAVTSISILSNIAVDNFSYKDLVLEVGTIKKLLKLTESDIPVQFVSNSDRLMSILCRFEHVSSTFETVKLCLPCSCKIIMDKKTVNCY